MVVSTTIKGGEAKIASKQRADLQQTPRDLVSSKSYHAGGDAGISELYEGHFLGKINEAVSQSSLLADCH